MTTSRLWLISGIAAFLAVVIGIAAAIATAVLPDVPSPTPTPSASAPATPDPAPSATPAPTSTASTFSPDCENTATEPFLALMASQSWTVVDTSREPLGARPFDDFLDGMPEITVVCRWGVDPSAATGTVIDLAWTILAAEAVADFVQRQVEGGAVFSEAPEGNYLETPTSGVYLFTESDTRWAQSRADLAYVKAPHD